MQDTLTTLEQICNQYDPTITPRSTSNKPKMETNNAKHTNLLGLEAKEPMNYNGYP